MYSGAATAKSKAAIHASLQDLAEFLMTLLIRASRFWRFVGRNFKDAEVQSAFTLGHSYFEIDRRDHSARYRDGRGIGIGEPAGDAVFARRNIVDAKISFRIELQVVTMRRQQRGHAFVGCEIFLGREGK